MSILFETIFMKSNKYSLEKQPYLQIIASIADLPKTVYGKGTLPKRRLASIAIIGTRRPTSYGTRIAWEFAENLARRGFVIISGLAYGIDTAAHKGALAANGVTIAVLAHGLDMVYPAGNRALSEAILKNGALISPYPDGTPVHRHRFLERNQWVSGLADAVLVVEAEQRSGTQSTIRYALDQGKEVFAVPGPIDRSQSWGPNHLIAEGAHPALHPDDIVWVIAPELLQHQPTTLHPHPDAQDILAQLKTPQTLDMLLTQTKSETAQLYVWLTTLELQGYIKRTEDGLYTLTS